MSNSEPLLYLAGSGDLLWEEEQKGKPWTSSAFGRGGEMSLGRCCVASQSLVSQTYIHSETSPQVASGALRSWYLNGKKINCPWICPPLSMRTRRAALVLDRKTAINPKPFLTVPNSKAPSRASRHGLPFSSWKPQAWCKWQQRWSGRVEKGLTILEICGTCSAEHH